MVSMLETVWSSLLNESINCSAIPKVRDGQTARELLRLLRQPEHITQEQWRRVWNRADSLESDCRSDGTLNEIDEYEAATEPPTDRS